MQARPAARCAHGQGSRDAAIRGVTSTALTATVDSVGPYVFTTRARPKRSSRRAATALGRVSPQNRKSRSAGMRSCANSALARHIPANEGVDTQTVAPDAASASI